MNPLVYRTNPIWHQNSEKGLAPQNSHLKSIVIMLGCFHTFMNVLGAIGTLMAGTGLKRLLEEVYGENAVVHMMTGKSVQRAFRGHLLVNKCLNQMVVSEILDEHPDLGPLVDKAENIYESLVNGELNLDSAVASDTLVS